MFQPKRKPRAHQARALELMEEQKQFALLAAMRTGKSLVVVCDFGRLAEQGKVGDLLVIAPAGAYMPWADAVGLDFPDELLDETKIFTWVSKRAKSKATRVQLDEFMQHSGPRVLVMNCEAVSAVAAARDLGETFLKQRPKRNMLVIDESVVIKNMTSTCSKFCVDELAPLAEYRRILSGLVSPRSPLDVYQQFRFLNKAIFPEPFEKFRDKYAVVRRICTLPKPVIQNKYFNALRLNAPASEEQLRLKAQLIWPTMKNFPPYAELHKRVMASPHTLRNTDMVDAIFRAGKYIQSIPIITDYKNIDELHQRIAPYSFRVKLEDCYDLPPSDYSFRDVPFHAEQERIYNELKAFAIAELEAQKVVTAANVVTQLLRLHQVLCGHTVDQNGERVAIPEHRTSTLVDLLQDYDGKAIIWASYDADIVKIQSALERAFGEGSVARFWGGNRDTREDEERKFKEDENCRFMVATAAAGGRGRTWDIADLVIYYSSTNNLDHRAQSEDRAKNVGKTRPVAYIDLRIPGTVEDKILSALRKKIDLAAVINGDDWKQWLV